ncbi:MAG: DoxX family membrane protein [Bacteroidales bacterium]|jgi:uncharacterized membrane protein YphA (DoxX/SURF4 family)|nr:DoxX family membrane protein [Bacteroidales bacterium]
MDNAKIKILWYRREQNIAIAQLILRILLGGLFVATALMKLFSIDQLELYIYSFDIFNYFLVSLVARLLIAFEIFIGIFLIFKIRYRITWQLTMLMMIAFTFFLIYTAIFRDDDNCHCFGEFIQLEPMESIVKNVITIVLLLFIRTEKYNHARWKRYVAIVGIALSLIVPFVVVPPDAFYNHFVSPNENIDQETFIDMQTDSVFIQCEQTDGTLTCDTIALPSEQQFSIQQLDSGRYVIAFYLSSCKFCQLGMNKIQSIIAFNHLDTAKFKAIIGCSHIRHMDTFKNKTHTEGFLYYPVSMKYTAKHVIPMVQGHFPTYVLVENKKVIRAINLRGIDENEIITFLK